MNNEPKQTLKITSVNLSATKGSGKKPVSEILVDGRGVRGDAHRGPGMRQVSMLSVETIEHFAQQTGRPVAPGGFAENLTVQGLDLGQVNVMDRFTAGELELEVTQRGKRCHGEACAIFKETGRCAMPQEGIFCRVIRGGKLKAGDELVWHPKFLRVRIITLSDRASRGDYEDESGPEIERLIVEHFKPTRWRLQVERALIPDRIQQLRQLLKAAKASGTDVVITTGGTGVGPRDITSDVVVAYCDKLIPGIMEFIRVKFGAEHPNALLSRSVAGTRGTMALYALPGSVRAVTEYMGEILKTLEHVVYMVHGLDMHEKIRTMTDK